MTATRVVAPSRAELDAARLLLDRMGIAPADLIATAADRPPAPTFAEYVPVVAAAVSAGTRRVYRSYWNRVLEHWATRRLDDIRPSDIEQLAEHVRAHVVPRRNARGGRSAAEHLIAALRCLYRHAVADGLLTEAENPARKVAKPRRLPSTRRALPDTRLAEINHIAASTGNDPVLDCLLLRLHTETACRRGGALALRPVDLDAEQCLIQLREKGGTVRWQPVSPDPDAAPARARRGTARACDRAAAALPQRPADHLPPLRPPLAPHRRTPCRGSPPSRSAPTGCGTPR